MVVSVLLAFSIGIFVITNRYMCANLSKRGDNRLSILANSLSAVVTLLVVCLVTQTAPFPQALSVTPANAFMVLGGLFFIIAISLSNYYSHKVPVFTMTIAMFLGKLFAGLLLDFFMLDKFSPGSFWGGILVACGLWISSKGYRSSR